MSSDLLGLATAWCRQGPGRSVQVNLVPGPETESVQRTIRRLGFHCVLETERSQIESIRQYTNETRTECCPVIFLRPRAPDIPIELLDSMMSSSTDLALLPTTNGGWHGLYGELPQAGLFDDIQLDGPQEARQTAERAHERRLTVTAVRPWPVVQTLSDLEALWHRLRADPGRAPRCHALLADW